MSASPYTLAQQQTLAILPKLSGFISCWLSLVIIYTILKDAKRRSKTYHRLICGLSVVDCSSSFWLGLSTWPIPRETGVLWAVGTPTTCHLQSFFTQSGIASIFYNASLSLYFLLVIQYGWRDVQIRTIEPYLHALPLAWALGSACIGLGLQVFDSANLWCWVSPKYNVFRWVAFYGPLWFMIIVITTICVMIWWHVRKIESITERRRQRTLQQYSHEPSSDAFTPSPQQAANAEDESDDVNHHTRVQFVSEAHATAGDDDRDYQDDDLNDVNVFAQTYQDENDKYYDDGMISGEYCVASSVFEDVVLSRTNQTLQTNRDATTCEPTSSFPRSPTSISDAAFNNNLHAVSSVDHNSHGGGSSHQVRRSYRQRRRRVSLLLARDQLRLKRTRQVARQSFFYAGAFYLNWTALSITRLLQTVQGKTYFPLLVIAAVTVPIQGLPNFLVYLAPGTVQSGPWSWCRSLYQQCRRLCVTRNDNNNVSNTDAENVSSRQPSSSLTPPSSEANRPA